MCIMCIIHVCIGIYCIYTHTCNVCMCVYVCIYICMRIICVYIYIYICTHTYTHLYYKCMNNSLSIYIYIYVYITPHFQHSLGFAVAERVTLHVRVAANR